MSASLSPAAPATVHNSTFAEWREEQGKGRCGRLPFAWKVALYMVLWGVGITQVYSLVTAHALLLDFMSNIFGIAVSSCLLTPYFFVWITIAGPRHNLEKLEEEKKLRQLEDDPPSVTQFPVSIVLKAHGCQYGEDQGYISFVDDLIYFTGLKTDFCLKRRENVSGIKKELIEGDNAVFKFKYEYDTLTSQMEVPDLQGKVMVELRIDAFRENRLARFQEELRAWWKTKDLVPTEHPILPPITPTRQATRMALRRARWHEVIGIVGCSLATAIFWPLDLEWRIAALLVVFVPCWLCAQNSSRTVFQLSDMVKGRGGRTGRRFIWKPILLTRWQSLFPGLHS
jgi:hypothetical protein